MEMYGFKSFADKTEIKYEGGITGIVGPNGCGKSNVADAIRWVLGEQSSKMLRGNNMQDVIFNGTERRKSLSYCEVSLFFDNTDHVFNIDYNEVVITRKLYRSGESEYLINREVCRLKDIVDLLHDVGIGKEGYSIIGQGKVEEIISSKPENRRAIFEEAAGIAKHKAKKLESERKLERTRDNLVRIHDIKSEIERQLGPLAKQAETAKKYLAYKEELKTFEVNNYIYQYEQASEVKSAIAEKIKAIEEETLYKTEDLNRANEDYAKTMEQVSQIDAAVSRIHEDVLNLTVAIEKSAGETKLYEERLSFLNEQKAKFEAEIASFTSALENKEKEKLEKQTSIFAKQTSLSQLKETSDKLMDEYMAIITELTSGEDAVSASQRQMIDSLDNLASVRANMSRLEAEKDALVSKTAEIKEKIKNLGSKVISENTKRAEIKSGVAKFEKEKESLKAELSSLEATISTLETNRKKLDAEESTLLTRVSALESRLKVLTEMQAENEGYASSVRKLLNDAKQKVELGKCILGTVAGLFKVEQKYEVAIEMALGGAVSNIVTEDENDAKTLINYLKNNRLGRATMLPLTSMKSRSIDSGYMAQVNKYSYGVASKLISFNPKFSGVFESLLGSTVIAEDIDKAIELAKNTRYAFRIVTLDGEVINPQGSLTGGSRKSEGIGLLSREREIASLKEEIVKTKALLENNLTAKEKLFIEENSAKIKEEKLEQKLTEAEVAYATANEALSASSVNLDAIHAEQTTLEKQTEDIASQISNINAQIELITAKQLELSDSKSEVSGDIEKRQKEFDELRQKRDMYNENITSIKVQIATLESEIVMLSDSVIEIDASIAEITSSRQVASENLRKSEVAISSCKDAVMASKDEEVNRENIQRLTALKEKLSQIEQVKVSEQAKLKQIEEDRLRLTSEVGRLQDKKYQQELNLTKVDTDIEVMQDRVFEEYELTYETALKFKEENYDYAEGVKEATRLKRAISELGHVNVNAIEDSKELGERFVTYQTQEEDLLKAEADIVQAIKELSDEMSKKFASEFEQIQNNFAKIFKELFGGGNAKLVLLESDDPLNAGIEIIAEPPGKKLQSITLLSGGEKALTAIAILFAILRLRPMPFCLLDEIEAALDEANVVRFASYLKRFSSETQFIVITHRKPTMELSDSLYGVTMEEKGVSKIVSVKLSDVQ